MNAARRTLRPSKPFVAPLIILLITSFASVDNLRQNLRFRRRDASLAKFLGKERLDRPTRAYCKTGGTLICAHGGDSSHHLPNTAEAFQSAIDSGVRCIEADVILTSDGRLMVLHKREILAMTKTGGTTPNNLTSELIFDIESRENVHIPTLEEILEQFLSQVDLMILDVKINHLPGAADNEGQTTRVLTAILRKYQRKNCLVWSESKNVIFAVKKKLRQILTGYIIKSKRYITQPNNFDGQARRAANIIAYHHHLVNRKIIDKAKNEGKQIIAWTANSDESIQRLLDLGIRGIVTDFPVQALKAVQKRNRWCKTSIFLQGRLLL